MPFRISLPCGVILRTWRMVKMNGGGMAAWGSAARGEFPPSSKRASDVPGAMLSGTMGPAARPTPQTLAYAGLSVATVGWAAGFVAGKVALGAMSPLVVAAWRYAVAAAILLPFALRQRPADGLGRAAGPLALMVVCGGVLYPWLFLLALSRTSATNTALLIALNPVLTLLFSPLVGERLDRRRLLGVLVALVGAATVLTRGDPAHLATPSLGSGEPAAPAAAAPGASSRRKRWAAPPCWRGCTGRRAPSAERASIHRWLIWP